MRILAIETSCDETAAAVVSGPPPVIESGVVASQIDLHKKYGGVFPELASRAHTETIIPVIEEALEKADRNIDSIDAIAVTVGPGLIGSLLVGVNAAKALAFATEKPLIPVNHLEGHIYANFIDHPDAKFPILALTVAGGHTQLVLMKKHLSYHVIGKTRDDSAGEAFDKVAKLLGLGYPGGQIIERVAREGDEKRYDFPRGMMARSTRAQGHPEQGRRVGEGYDFSFSGLKTAVLYQTQKMSQDEIKKATPDLVASFQQAVVDVLVAKTIQAAREFHPRSIFLSGGVAANTLLRETLGMKVKQEFPDTLFVMPELLYCTDNAAMIGVAAVYRHKASAGGIASWEEVEADPNATLEPVTVAK